MMKELALQTIQELPEDVSMIDIIEALYMRVKAEQGLRDIKEGNSISHEELKREIEKW